MSDSLANSSGVRQQFSAGEHDDGSAHDMCSGEHEEQELEEETENEVH